MDYTRIVSADCSGLRRSFYGYIGVSCWDSLYLLIQPGFSAHINTFSCNPLSTSFKHAALQNPSKAIRNPAKHLSYIVSTSLAPLSEANSGSFIKETYSQIRCTPFSNPPRAIKQPSRKTTTPHPISAFPQGSPLSVFSQLPKRTHPPLPPVLPSSYHFLSPYSNIKPRRQGTSSPFYNCISGTLDTTSELLRSTIPPTLSHTPRHIVEVLHVGYYNARRAPNSAIPLAS